MSNKRISAKHTLELCVTIPLTILPAATAVTTLVFMGHNQHWQIIHDELIAAPIIVVGFGLALTMFIITLVTCGRISDS
jgi:ABC-type molybdate transport system permease subunit